LKGRGLPIADISLAVSTEGARLQAVNKPVSQQFVANSARGVGINPSSCAADILTVLMDSFPQTLLAGMECHEEGGQVPAVPKLLPQNSDDTLGGVSLTSRAAQDL
jgi:hypothetical protein